MISKDANSRIILDVNAPVEICIRVNAPSAGPDESAIADAVSGSTGPAFWVDFSDGAKIWEDSGKTDPAETGDFIKAAENKYGTSPTLLTLGVADPVWDETAGSAVWAGDVDRGIRYTNSSWATDTYAAMVVQMAATPAQFILMSFGASQNAGIAQNGDANPPISSLGGSASVHVDGVTVATRDALYDALNDGAKHLVEFKTFDPTGLSVLDLCRRSSSWLFDGEVFDVVLCDTPGDTAALAAVLNNKHGI